MKTNCTKLLQYLTLLSTLFLVSCGGGGGGAASPTATLTSIAITPTSATIAPGGTRAFTAIGTYSDSSTSNISGSVTWKSSNTAVATINTSGIASGLALGASSISASSSGKTSNTATLNVGGTLTAALQQGTYWEFMANTKAVTFAQGSGTTTATDFGRFRLTLGAPVQISSVTMYPVVLSGDANVGGTNYAPQWTHIGISNGAILGSIGGGSLQVIFHGTATSGLSDGFFINFAANETVNASNSTFTGDYNTLSAIRVGHSLADGGCETILGYTICQDTSTTFSENEYYKDGVGPLGFKRDATYTYSGGGFYTSHTFNDSIELVGTSLTPADNSTINPPPWNEVAPLSTARKNHAATAYNGKVYVFGGHDPSNALLSSVEVYDPVANAWTAGTSLPVALSFHRAETTGSRTFLIGSNKPVRIFDHASNTWATGVTSPFNDPSFDTDIWVDTVNNLTFVIVAVSNINGQIDVFGYEINQDQWYYGISLATLDHRWFALSVVGNNFYLNGGYRQYLSPKVFSGNYRYNLSTDAWTTTGLGTPSVARYSAASVNLSDNMLVLGGQTIALGALRDVESYNQATNSWAVVPSMLHARNYFPAVVLGGKVYAIGGSNASSAAMNFVEAYTP